MRSIFILVPFVFHFVLFTVAQRAGRVEPEQPKGPEPQTPENPSGSTGRGDQDEGKPIGVPGALAMGKNPKPAPEDDEIDFETIADKLKELVKKITKAVDKSPQTTTTTTATITQGPLDFRTAGCSSALNAYSSCSTAYNGTFSAVPATAQAGCLCNAKSDFDFNFEMRECYSYAQAWTQYHSYASFIANATAACTCVPNTAGPEDYIYTFNGCTPISSPTTTTSSSTAAVTSSSQTTHEADVSPSPTGVSPSPTGAARSLSACLSIVVTVAALVLMSILY